MNAEQGGGIQASPWMLCTRVHWGGMCTQLKKFKGDYILDRGLQRVLFQNQY